MGAAVVAAERKERERVVVDEEGAVVVAATEEEEEDERRARLLRVVGPEGGGEEEDGGVEVASARLRLRVSIQRKKPRVWDLLDQRDSDRTLARISSRNLVIEEEIFPLKNNRIKSRKP